MAQTKPFSQVSPPMTTQPNSSLLSLPPEIRNDIYERVFDYMVFDARSLSYGPRNFTAKNLLLTCKQIHTEAIKVFYSTTTFHFVPHESIPFRSWICKFGPARVSLMKDVRCDRLFEGHDRYDDIDLEGDEAVLWNARRAQKYIDRQKDDFSLHEGVLKVQIWVEHHQVWTALPYRLASRVLEQSVYLGRERCWISEPVEDLEREFPFILPLEYVDSCGQRFKAKATEIVNRKRELEGLEPIDTEGATN